MFEQVSREKASDGRCFVGGTDRLKIAAEETDLVHTASKPIYIGIKRGGEVDGQRESAPTGCKTAAGG